MRRRSTCRRRIRNVVVTVTVTVTDRSQLWPVHKSSTSKAFGHVGFQDDATEDGRQRQWKVAFSA